MPRSWRTRPQRSATSAMVVLSPPGMMSPHTPASCSDLRTCEACKRARSSAQPRGWLCTTTWTVPPPRLVRQPSPGRCSARGTSPATPTHQQQGARSSCGFSATWRRQADEQLQMLRSEAPEVLLLRTRQAARSDRARRARCFDRCTFRTILSNERMDNSGGGACGPAPAASQWGPRTGLTRGARAPEPVLVAGS